MLWVSTDQIGKHSLQLHRPVIHKIPSEMSNMMIHHWILDALFSDTSHIGAEDKLSDAQKQFYVFFQAFLL